MATAYNSIIYLYKGVPLIKGGTEVLYEYQDNAVQALETYLHRTFFQYYYVRENRQYVRIKATMPEIEGCNYLAFRNPSNGNKWFFGFIDLLVYINDNTVEIEFTIDPFPTYLGDTTPHIKPYIIRKTVEPDTLYEYNEYDVDLFGKGVQYETVSHNVFAIDKTILMFTCDTTFTGAGNVTIQGKQTGIQYLVDATVAQVQSIVEAGGQVLGCYGVDSTFSVNSAMSGVTISPSLSFVGTHNKLKGGQYNKISIVTGSMAKEFDLMKFTNKPAISFCIKRLFNPAPCIAVYPLDYEGVAENTAEALLIPYPSIAMNYQDNFSISTAISNLKNIFTSSVETNGVRGNTEMNADWYTQSEFAHTGFNGQTTYYPMNVPNLRGAVENAKSFMNAGFNRGRALPNFAGTIGNVLKSAMPSAGINTSAGNLILNSTNEIIIDVVHAHHYQSDAEKLDAYFDYYGYSINAFDYTNVTDGAYLQTGEDFLYGSEADDVLNSYIKRGIKIRRSLA